MEISEFNIPGLKLITPKRFTDERGFFMESFQTDRYAQVIQEHFVQDNISNSKKGVIRGLHFQQPPHAQGKLVQVLRGAVSDIALDLRKSSPTFGMHVQVEISAENGQQFYIPPGFAHGFQALEDDTLFLYKCTNFYAAADELTLRWDDPVLDIQWPIKPAITSPKDEKGWWFNEFKSPF
jgi:dTDP-4-dehydrorhamnose 3,5-epimerase